MLYLGCSQWNYKFLKKNNGVRHNLLNIYSKEFNCCELNSTFYDLPQPDMISKWKSDVNPDFRFCPKFPEIISHQKYLNSVEEDIDAFIENVNMLSDNLGICFLQLSPRMFHSGKSRLKNFLEYTCNRIKVSVELRPEWLADSKVISYCIAMLKEYNAGIVLVDGAETIQHLNKLKLTNQTAFIRFLSYEHPTDFGRIDDWTGQLKRFFDNGVNEIYFILHFGDREYKPEIIDYAKESFEDFRQ